MIDRRGLILKGLFLVIGATTSATLLGCTEKNVKYKDLKKLLSNKDFEDIFDAEVIEDITTKQSHSADQLIEKIFQEKLPKTKEEVFKHIHISAKQDFKSGNTVIIDGWLFSDTIVEFATLQHKLNRFF